ncbi:MAG TPA: hypothetical protein QGF58_09425 [Myxococcota bacterium]|nr:hypothetical protein [Myxococcota bacterium]
MELATGTLIRDRYKVLEQLGGPSWKVKDRQTGSLGVFKRLTGRGVPDDEGLKADDAYAAPETAMGGGRSTERSLRSRPDAGVRADGARARRTTSSHEGPRAVS